MYRVFKRSVKSWKDFATARKITEAYVETEQEALQICDRFNHDRTNRQIAKGTKMEYMKV